MKTLYIILGTALLLLCAAGYRYLQVLPYPIGTGEEARSPDGRYAAKITSLFDEDFWGHKHSWYEFELLHSTGARINLWKTDPIPFAHFGSRTGTNVVNWLDDSSAARFTLPGIEITMRPQQGVAPLRRTRCAEGER